MIPQLVSISGAPYAVLPPGVHRSTLPEVHDRFAFNERREWLFGGLTLVAKALRSAGASSIFLGGSFVSSKDEPNDFDGYWDPSGVALDQLDPTLLDFENEQYAQKYKYRGEMFIASEDGPLGSSIRDLFRKDRYTEIEKGILRINLKGVLQ